jgi:hypothetical protein
VLVALVVGVSGTDLGGGRSRYCFVGLPRGYEIEPDSFAAPRAVSPPLHGKLLHQEYVQERTGFIKLHARILKINDILRANEGRGINCDNPQEGVTVASASL